MKRLVFGLLGLAVIASGAFAGTEIYSGKEMKQVAPPPCPEWYADNEFNVGFGHLRFHRKLVARRPLH